MLSDRYKLDASDKSKIVNQVHEEHKCWKDKVQNNNLKECVAIFEHRETLKQEMKLNAVRDHTSASSSIDITY